MKQHKPVDVRQREVPELSAPVHDNPLMNRILAARGICHRDDHSFSLRDMPSPHTLPDINAVVQRLIKARSANERILIVGDYDCDGATSTAVAMLGLRMLGFQHVDYIIPSRFDNGYGLSPAIVDIAHAKHQAQLILTVDNGVASVSAVAHAAAQQIDVIVTDHHLAPEQLPSALAIVNPTLPGVDFDGQNLAGVGVIFYTLIALRSSLKLDEDDFADAPLQQLLDLVAIGTVADVVKLDKLNRKLVEQGLRRIRAGHTRPGVLALLAVAGRDASRVTTQDIGFAIGPRLNAAGRIDDMRIGVQCLLSESQEAADSMAAELDKLNVKRRSIEGDMQKDALAQLDAISLDADATQNLFAICLRNDSWHEGVIGILAGRIKELTYKPVVIFTEDDENHLKGSARSIPGVHIRDVLQNIAAQHTQMITKFGGHAMAAGLTLRKSCFEEFRTRLNESVSLRLNGQHSQREYVTDGALDASERTLENAMLLATGMPWGQGFEAPLFCDRFQVVMQKPVRNGHLQLRLKAPDNPQSFKAIAFNQTPIVSDGEWVRAVYALEANQFRSEYTVQLRIQYLEAVEA